jgi:hypothetical protein
MLNSLAAAISLGVFVVVLILLFSLSDVFFQKPPEWHLPCSQTYAIFH